MSDPAELSHGAKWALEAIEKNTAELRKEIVRLETALDENTGVVQQLKPYPWAVWYARDSCMSSFRSPEAAKAAAETAYQNSLPVKAENEGIVAHNRAVLNRLLAVLKNAGLPETTRVRQLRSRTKSISVDTEWKASLSQHIPMNDGWWSVQEQYKSWVSRCDDMARKTAQEKEATERARQRHEQEIEREVVRRELVKKYSLVELSADEAFNALLDRDQYLRLAHYLQKNRGDWSDGCWYAEIGLRGFKIETDTDRLILRDIQRQIEHWDGDGRVFRDCEWSYDRLFLLARERNAELVADYDRLSALIGDGE